jgi:hypothetical protein
MGKCKGTWLKMGRFFKVKMGENGVKIVNKLHLWVWRNNGAVGAV